MRDMNSRSTTPTAPSSTPLSSPSGGIYGDHMRIAACCNQGGRKYMEDRINIHCEFTENGQVDYIYVGVYDGHGGADASNFANQHLLQNIVKQPGFSSSQDSDVMEAIRAGFLETHHAMRKVVDGWPKTASGFTSTSGTTASVAFIRRGKVYTGHVGDSGIVLGSQKPTGEFIGSSLTVDHKPDSPEERKRIEEIGGEVMNKSGVMRVVWVRPLRGHQGPVRRSTPKEKIPFLAVARALGDLWSYNSDMDAYVVSPEPDVSVLQLDSTHRCLIFGSDGLWNVLRPQHAVDIVNSHEWKEDEISWIVNQNEGYETNHARWLVRHALMRWGNLRADNISVVTIIFGNRGISDSIYAKRVERDGLSIEDILTTEPTSIIKVAPNRVTAVPTKPVELVFYGVSEAAPVERRSFFSGSYLLGSDSATQNDYHKIPGYTNHERGPIFGSLLSTGTSTSPGSSSIIARGSLTTTSSYRQYSQSSNIFSAVGTSQAVVGKENGSVKRNSPPASVTIASRATAAATTTTTTRVTAGNNEEESEAEDDTAHVTTTVSTLEADLIMETTPQTEAHISDNQENGRTSGGGIGSGLLKLSTTPCKIHNVVSCCSCTLTRAPLTQWLATPAETRPQKEQEFTAVTPKKEAPVRPLFFSTRRHTTSASPSGMTNLMDAYKCRRLGKQRRSCPNPATPHNYNTRQSCRTTRAGTKLSPQKSLFNKVTTITPSVESGYKGQNRQFIASRRRLTMPQATAPTPPTTSLRSRRRRSCVIRQPETDPEATPKRFTPAPATDVRPLRKSSKCADRMRLRSAKTPTVSSTPAERFALSIGSTEMVTGKKCSLSDEGTKAQMDGDRSLADASLDTLGAQFLESLNLETPSAAGLNRHDDGEDAKRQLPKTPLTLDEMMADAKGFLHTRSSGSKSRNNYKAMMNRSKNAGSNERRRSANLATLKRKLYFDDQALMEQRPATTPTAITKRIKGLSLTFVKRST